MQFQTLLQPATLIRRYKRFLADIRLDDGTEAVAHCPNPGAMLGLNDPGLRIWVEPTPDPRKKLDYAWRLAELPDGQMAGIDTSVPNRIVKEALEACTIPELAGFETLRPEQPYSKNSRIDFLLDGPRRTYVEVKNVHLRRTDDWAEFPDCVTKRGAKHLRDLIGVVENGQRAVMLYVVQRTDCERFRLAADIDPEYARCFDLARASGVEMLCYGTHITPQSVEIIRPLPIDSANQCPS